MKPHITSRLSLSNALRAVPVLKDPRGFCFVFSLSNVSLSSAKPEDMLWFHRAVTMSQILRYLTYGEKQGEQFTNDAVADAAHAVSAPMAYTRLLVISGTFFNAVCEASCREGCAARA